MHEKVIPLESRWEKEWREYEENNMERAKIGERPKKCDECKDPAIQCYNLPFVQHVRIIYFKDFNQKTFSLDSIEECLFRKVDKTTEK